MDHAGVRRQKRTELAEPHRLEFLVSFADENGSTIRAFLDANWPLEMLSVVTFAPHAGIGHGTVIGVEWNRLTRRCKPAIFT